jgi:hypothetical protein
MSKESVTFKLHQCYEKPGDTKQMFCEICEHDIFKVGQGSYYTVVMCAACGHEECIHDG